MAKKMRTALAFALLAALFIAGLMALSRGAKPACDCFFPNTGTYGVLDRSGACRPLSCTAADRSE